MSQRKPESARRYRPRLCSSMLPAVAVALLFAVASAGACGGKDEPTIKHRLDMASLAPTPPEARGPVAEAYRSHYEAELERAHTEFALEDSRYALQIARARQAQSKHDQKIARLESKRGEAAFMTSLASAAAELLNDRKKAAQAQKLEIRYLKAQRKYLRKYLLYTEAQVLAAEASLELAKAKLAKERGTMPTDFNFSKFVSQEKSFKERAARRNQKSKSLLAKAQAKEKAWKQANK